jgi:glycosyltransferase involved in cell wall biosynthesis
MPNCSVDLDTERMTMHDAISVALCTHNGEQFLAEQLASIGNQTCPPAELVVTDDASTDGTLAVLNNFASTARFRVKVHQNDLNLGSTASFEETIARCSCPLIALCDQDDVWRPEKLERLSSELHRQPAAGYAFSDAEVVDEQLQPLNMRMWETVGLTPQQLEMFTSDRQVDLLLGRTLVTGATLMIRAEHFDLCRPIPLNVMHDMWLALMLTALGAYGVPIAEPLVQYRQHGRQQIGAVMAHRPRTVRDMMQREFVAERRQKLHQEARGAKLFIERLDRLLAEPSRLLEAQRENVTHARLLAEDRARHITARAALDNVPLPRVVSTLLRELVRGCYGRYSGGLNALLFDALYCWHYRKGKGSERNTTG